MAAIQAKKKIYLKYIYLALALKGLTETRFHQGVRFFISYTSVKSGNNIRGTESKKINYFNFKKYVILV